MLEDAHTVSVGSTFVFALTYALIEKPVAEAPWQSLVVGGLLAVATIVLLVRDPYRATERGRRVRHLVELSLRMAAVCAAVIIAEIGKRDNAGPITYTSVLLIIIYAEA